VAAKSKCGWNLAEGSHLRIPAKQIDRNNQTLAFVSAAQSTYASLLDRPAFLLEAL